MPAALHCSGNAQPGGASKVLEATSDNWSGYAAVSARQQVRCVEGSWVQPAVVCPSRGYAATSIWVGIDGLDTPNLRLQAGKTLVQIGTQAECEDGAARYESFTEALPDQRFSQITPLAVRPGDRIRAIVRAGSKGTFKMQIRNVTLGTAYNAAAAVSKPRLQTAEWVVEAPARFCSTKCRTQRLANFGVVVLHGQATIGGVQASIGGSGSFKERLLMTRKDIDRVAVSTLSRTGTRFSVRWRHL
jgi:hypothetical protein